MCNGIGYEDLSRQSRVPVDFAMRCFQVDGSMERALCGENVLESRHGRRTLHEYVGQLTLHSAIGHRG